MKLKLQICPVIAALAGLLAGATRASADVVTDWNATAETALFAGHPPPVAYVEMAIVQAAVHDAVQAIDRRFQPYHVDIPGASGSPAAAAAKAARDVLVNILTTPTQVASLDAAYVASLAKYGLAENDPGVAVGAKAAAGILALRANDGRVPNPVPPPYVGSTNLGAWRPTLPAFAPMVAPWLGTVLPFILNSGDQYRPPPPPPLTSQRYAQDYQEVKALGGSVGSARSPEQTELAYFFGAISFHKTLRDIADAQLDNIGDRARLLALANLAIADSFITVWDAKKFFNYWRPITAIQEGNNDGNPETAADPNWLPLFPTPAYPEYTSGYNAAAGALTRTLAHVFGTDYRTFTVTSTHALAVQKTRTYYRFSHLSDDSVDVRIYQGLHFRAADEETQKLSRSVADWAFARYLRPLGEVKTEPDVVLQHPDGSLAFWTMNGTTIVDSSVVAGAIPAGWKIVGAGDFNYDAQRDLVLQHTDGSVAFWMLDGTTITEHIVLFAVPAGWRIVATGDFNNDIQVDLVLQNVNGLIAFWFMDGTSVTGTQLSHQPAGWRVAGTGRFDHNATTDIVLQHNDGSVAFWLMDGTTIVKGFVAYQIPQAWQIAATGNFNSDNDTDMVLQHTDGSVAFWLMDGTTITKGVVPYVVPGWQIVGPR